MVYIPSEVLAKAYTAAVDLAVRLPAGYISEINVHPEGNGAAIGFALGNLAAKYKGGARTHLMNAIDGAGREPRMEKHAEFPNGTLAFVFPYNLAEVAEAAPPTPAMPAKTTDALRSTRDFIDRHSLFSRRIVTRIWSPFTQTGELVQRVSTGYEVNYRNEQEFSALQVCIAEGKILRSQWSPARPRVLPSHIWEIELPYGGQTLTLQAVDQTPKGIAEEKSAARKEAREQE